MEFVKKNWKWMVALLLLLFTLFIYYQNYNLKEQLKSERVEYKLKEEMLNTAIKSWKGENGRLYSDYEREIMMNKWKSTYIDSLAHIIKVKQKNIESLTILATRTTGGGKLVVDTSWSDVDDEQPDSVNTVISPTYIFTFNDPWTKIWGSIGPDSSGVLYTVSDTIKITDYWKTKRILGLPIGKTKGYVNFTNTNPNTRIVGAKKVDLKPPKKNWSLGIGAQLGYPINSWNWKEPVLSVGVSVHRTIIRF